MHRSHRRGHATRDYSVVMMCSHGGGDCDQSFSTRWCPNSWHWMQQCLVPGTWNLSPTHLLLPHAPLTMACRRHPESALEVACSWPRVPRIFQGAIQEHGLVPRWCNAATLLQRYSKTIRFSDPSFD